MSGRERMERAIEGGATALGDHVAIRWGSYPDPRHPDRGEYTVIEVWTADGRHVEVVTSPSGRSSRVYEGVREVPRG